MNIQGWFPLGLTGWISLQHKGLPSLLQHQNSKASTVWHSAFFIVQLSPSYMTTGKTIAFLWQTFVGKLMSLLFNMLSQFSSVQSLSHVWLFVTPWIVARQASCPSSAPGVHSDSRPSSQWCHPAISSSVIPFSSCPQSLPASGSLLMSQLFTWGGQSTGVSALASVLPMNTQKWSPFHYIVNYRAGI